MLFQGLWQLGVSLPRGLKQHEEGADIRTRRGYLYEKTPGQGL